MFTRQTQHGTKRLYIPVVREKDLDALKKYQNKGEDRSLLRKYVLNYLYEFITNKIFPTTLAPNMVTLIGFFAILLHGFLCFHFSPYFNDEVPRWVFLVNATCMFFYQTMDNCDGKQARRTGTSSPLGDLFDHGCDALTVWFGAISICTVCEFGPTFTSFFVFVTGMITFVIQTWEEYHVGGLFLPEINGAIEGLLILVYVQFLGFWHGPQVLQLPFNEFVGVIVGGWAQSLAETIIPGFLNSITAARGVSNILILSAIGTTIKSTIDVSKASQKKGKTVFDALPDLIPFIVIFGGSTLWVLLSPADIMGCHPYLMLAVTGISSAYFCNHITLSFILNTDIKEMIKDPMLFAWIAALGNLALGVITGGFLMVPETIALLLLFFVVFAIYSNYVLAMFMQISTFLRIPIFTIRRPRRKTASK